VRRFRFLFLFLFLFFFFVLLFHSRINTAVLRDFRVGASWPTTTTILRPLSWKWKQPPDQ
jgi:hypothetical protein